MNFLSQTLPTKKQQNAFSFFTRHIFQKQNFINSAIFVVMTSFVTNTSAGLVLNPQRIVLEDRDRAAALELLNTDETEGRYQVYFEHKRMLENGSIVDIEESEKSGPYASEMIRYSPRRVDIAGGDSQTIRLAVRRPKDLEDGEYLSHLVLKQIPNKLPTNQESSSSEDDKQLNLSVQPVLKLAIPVIVRKGNLNAESEISDINLSINDGVIEGLAFTLHRSGNRSLYGDVEIYEDNNGKRVGFVRGIALYHQTPKRLVNVKLDEPLPINGQTLRVRFNENGKYGGDILIDKTITAN